MIQWQFDKTFPTSRRGLVATKHPVAARVGVNLLRRGGNAVDAAVATSFALGVVEPYMSGVGGGGLALLQLEGEPPRAYHFGMRAPAASRADMYDVLPGTHDVDLFGWPRTRDDENLLGPRSVALPGLVAGLHALWQEAGTVPWSELVAPAIALAIHGLPVDWLLSLRILQGFELLSQFPVSRSIYLSGGRPLKPELAYAAEVLRQPALGRALQQIADDPDALSKGDLAASLTDATDGRLQPEDIDNNGALAGDPLRIAFGDLEVCAAPWATGGATLIEWLGILQALDPPRDASDPALWWAIVEAGDVAFADRLERLADPDFVPFPDELLAPAYHRRMADAIRSGEVDTIALPPTVGSTSHLSVVDARGNAVSITQTLLSLWGSGVVTRSGICLNNGMMWFDPEPGRHNSIAGNKRPLANMCPVLVLKDGKPFMAIGASGGRRIMPALVQILVRVELLGMSFADAIAAPRLDTSTQNVIADVRFGDTLCRDMARRLRRPLQVKGPVLGISPWASPAGVMRLEDGRWTAGADPYTMACALEA